jgi:hypothetical protein
MMVQQSERARNAAADAGLLARIALGIVAATVIISFGVSSYRTAAALGAGAAFLDYVRALGPGVVLLLPAALFTSALYRLTCALKEFEAGRFFSPACSRAVRLAGQDAAWALAAQIVIAPTLLLWIRAQGGIDFRFEIVDLALAAFLVFVAVVGRVLEIAAAVQADNEAFV